MAAVRTATRRGCGARGMAEAGELDVGRRAMHDCPPLSAMQLECGHGRSSLGAVGGAHAGSNGTGASMAPHTNRVRLCRTPLVGAVTRSPCAVDPCGSQGCSPAIRTQCLILPLNHAARSQTCGTAWFVPAWIQHTTYARSDLAGHAPL